MDFHHVKIKIIYESYKVIYPDKSALSEEINYESSKAGNLHYTEEISVKDEFSKGRHHLNTCDIDA